MKELRNRREKNSLVIVFGLAFVDTLRGDRQRERGESDGAYITSCTWWLRGSRNWAPIVMTVLRKPYIRLLVVVADGVIKLLFHLALVLFLYFPLLDAVHFLNFIISIVTFVRQNILKKCTSIKQWEVLRLFSITWNVLSAYALRRITTIPYPSCWFSITPFFFSLFW